MAQEKVIVVGAGDISKAWFPPLKAEGVNVVAVVDLNLDAARGAIDKFQLTGAVASTELDKVLRDHKADFLLDLTVPPSHREVVIKGLKAGLHVLGEKPMASSMEAARDMVRASEQTGRLYMVSQSRRWDPNHESVQRTIATGALGNLTALYCDFFIAPHFGGFREEMPSPLLLDMAIHHMDLSRMFSGQNPVSVYAEEFNPKGSWYKGNASANCLYEMTNGVHFVYRGSWCSEGCHTSWNGTWRIIGDKGTMIYPGDKLPTGEVVAGNEGITRPKAPLAVVTPTLEYKAFHGSLREMLRFLRSGQTPQTECHDNINSLAMVFSAIESARAGSRVKVVGL